MGESDAPSRKKAWSLSVVGNIVPFGKQAPPKSRAGKFRRSDIAVLLALLGLAALGYRTDEREPTRIPARNETVSKTSFTLCAQSRRINCVIDGDTFAFGGHRVRLADIDTPETHPSRCDYEAQLGARATRRLQELLNAGPFELEGSGDRDEDQYGRKLRIVTRDGNSLGGALVSEGLAREWTGRRLPWCR